MDEEKEVESPRYKHCQRELDLGVDAIALQHGVMGPRGFVPLEDRVFFCDEDCLEGFATSEEIVKIRRRIP